MEAPYFVFHLPLKKKNPQSSIFSSLTSALCVTAAKNFFRVSDRAGRQLQSHCFQASDAFNKQQWINCIRQAREAAALSGDAPQGAEERLEAERTGTPGETEGSLCAEGAKSAWGEIETGPCLEEAGSQSAKEEAGELAEVDGAETGSGGAPGLDGGADPRVEMDTGQLGCGKAKAKPNVELEAEAGMDGGAEAGPFSSAAPCREEEEREMEEEQAVGAEEVEEVGMDTSEGGSPQCEELTQRC